MKTQFLIFYLLTLSFSSFAQKPVLVLGFETGGWVVSRVNRQTNQTLFAYSLCTEPRLGIVLKDKFVVGLHYFKGFTRGDSINQQEYPDIHGLGFFSRYFFPFRFKRSKVFKDRFRFFSEMSVSFTDYYLGPPRGVVKTTKQFETFLKADFGFDLRYGNLHLEYSIRPIYVLGRQFVLGKRLGFSYWFQKGNKEEPFHPFKNIKRNKKPTYLSHFGERIILGSSYTYIPDISDIDPELKYKEYTLNVDAAINLNSRWYLGISYKDIRTSGSTVSIYEEKKENYHIVGIFAQYDFLAQYKYRFFAHISGNYGNYCTCGDGDPYKIGGLHYLGLGLGFDYPLLPWLSIDLAGIGYAILDRVDSKYAFTQYVVGLNIDIVRKK